MRREAEFELSNLGAILNIEGGAELASELNFLPRLASRIEFPVLQI